MNHIDTQVREFVTELLMNNPDQLFDITDCLITSLGTVIMASSLNHSDTMRYQGDAVIDSLRYLIDNIVKQAEQEERTESKH